MLRKTDVVIKLIFLHFSVFPENLLRSTFNRYLFIKVKKIIEAETGVLM